MKRIASISLVVLMSGSVFTANAAPAQPRHDNDRYETQRHDDRRDNRAHGHNDRNERDSRGWYNKSDYRKGGHIAYKDWNRGRQVNYRKHKRLSAPPRGYEWRQVDNRYVLAAVATGVIAAIILSN